MLHADTLRANQEQQRRDGTQAERRHQAVPQNINLLLPCPDAKALDEIRWDGPPEHRPSSLQEYNPGMARYTLVYGLRLIPEGSLKALDDATITLADGTKTGVTLHTFDGTIPQLRRSLDRSLDAFFDLLPGADDEDVERFAD